MGLRDLLGGRQANSVAVGEIKELTDQFYVTLRAYYARMQRSTESLPRTPFNASRIN